MDLGCFHKLRLYVVEIKGASYKSFVILCHVAGVNVPATEIEYETSISLVLPYTKAHV